MTGAALITGGQSGIGLGIARALAGAGWRVALAAEVAPGHPSVAAALAAMPGAVYRRHDLADAGGAQALAEAVEAEMGPLTCFVSNAGVPALRRGDLLDVSEESFDRCHAVNLRGAFFLAQAVARRMLATPGEGRTMVFVTSVSAAMVSAERAEYCISKAGAAMAARAFAARLAPHGIDVFELRPGIVATPMTEPVRGRYDRLIAEGLVPARRWGTPEDAGRAVLALASGALPFATGSVVALDGGLSIPRL